MPLLASLAALGGLVPIPSDRIEQIVERWKTLCAHPEQRIRQQTARMIGSMAAGSNLLASHLLRLLSEQKQDGVGLCTLLYALEVYLQETPAADLDVAAIYTLWQRLYETKRADDIGVAEALSACLVQLLPIDPRTSGPFLATCLANPMSREQAVTLLHTTKGLVSDSKHAATLSKTTLLAFVTQHLLDDDLVFPFYFAR